MQQQKLYPHLQKFYENELPQYQQPTQSLLSSLQKLEKILQQKQNSILEQSQLHQQLSTQITYEQVQLIKQYQDQILINQSIVRVVQITQDIHNKIEELSQATKLEHKLAVFRGLYGLIGRLQTTLIEINNEQQKKKQQNKPHQQQQLSHLKSQYLHNLQSQILSKQQKYQNNTVQIGKIQKSLDLLGLPIKHENKQKQQQLLQQPHPLANTNQYKEAVECVRDLLFGEYCCYCLVKKIDIVRDQEQGGDEGGRDCGGGFYSLFFDKLWDKVRKAVEYIFLNTSGQQQSAYQIQQPNWMFQYLQQIFSLNYQYICTKLLSPSASLSSGSSLSLASHKQSLEYIQTYFLSYNIDNLFLHYILLRLQTDMSVIAQLQTTNGSNKKVPQSVRKRNCFLVFNFLDELQLLSERIAQNYDYEGDFVQSVLLWGQQRGTGQGGDILARNFDYEHQFIQQRIFTDFSNINYSNITDLKNIQSYNITINFINIFEKLYNKFKKIKNEELQIKINQFYYEKILQLCRHIITTFERIYNYSSINKYEILTSYKKIENQFYTYFNSYISQSPSFQQKIKQQYYSPLEKSIQVLALQELTTTHKKVYKRLSDNNTIFTSYQFEQNQLSENKEKWSKIFQDWRSKLEKINKLCQLYEDKKLRNIFFTFLESVDFCEDGFLYFISIFQPFLIVIFSVEETKVIKMLLEMDKSALTQYSKMHQNMLWFLSGAEIRAIKKCKIGNK